MLIEIFREFKKHPAIVPYMPLDEKVYYGPETTRGATSYPYIKWIPTGDTYEPPLWVNKNAIIDGKRVQIEACFSRACGVEIRIYEEDYFKLETLINTSTNALYDVLVSTGNFRIQNGRMLNQEELTTESVGYAQTCTIWVPIYRVLPSAVVQDTLETVRITVPS